MSDGTPPWRDSCDAWRCRDAGWSTSASSTSSSCMTAATEPLAKGTGVFLPPPQPCGTAPAGAPASRSTSRHSSRSSSQPRSRQRDASGTPSPPDVTQKQCADSVSPCPSVSELLTPQQSRESRPRDLLVSPRTAPSSPIQPPAGAGRHASSSGRPPAHPPDQELALRLPPLSCSTSRAKPPSGNSSGTRSSGNRVRRTAPSLLDARAPYFCRAPALHPGTTERRSSSSPQKAADPAPTHLLLDHPGWKRSWLADEPATSSSKQQQPQQQEGEEQQQQLHQQQQQQQQQYAAEGQVDKGAHEALPTQQQQQRLKGQQRSRQQLLGASRRMQQQQPQQQPCAEPAVSQAASPPPDAAGGQALAADRQTSAAYGEQWHPDVHTEPAASGAPREQQQQQPVQAYQERQQYYHPQQQQQEQQPPAQAYPEQQRQYHHNHHHQQQQARGWEEDADWPCDSREQHSSDISSDPGCSREEAYTPPPATGGTWTPDAAASDTPPAPAAAATASAELGWDAAAGYAAGGYACSTPIAAAHPYGVTLVAPGMGYTSPQVAAPGYGYSMAMQQVMMPQWGASCYAPAMAPASPGYSPGYPAGVQMMMVPVMAAPSMGYWGGCPVAMHPGAAGQMPVMQPDGSCSLAMAVPVMQQPQ